MYIVSVSICSFRVINIARLIMFVQRISVFNNISFYYLSILIINFFFSSFSIRFHWNEQESVCVRVCLDGKDEYK